MKLSVHVIDVNNADTLKELVNKKFDKILHVYDEVLSGEVTIKKSKAMDPGPKVVELKLHVSGTDLFAKKESEKPEEAIELAFEAVSRQLVKFKEKKDLN